MPVEPRGEFERIRAIVDALPAGRDVVLGPGDDAAVLRPRPGHDLVVTTDAFIEGLHWRADLLDSAGVGRRLAAANLSDLAAMGAEPRWATIACGASPQASASELRAIELACAAALAAEGAAIVGGNLSATQGPAWFCVTLFGEVEAGAHWTRAGARAGDLLAVTGSPGRSAATLALALRTARADMAAVPPELATWYAAPPCRVRAARALAATGGVHAAIDISDGLAGDLAHLCAASGVGAVVDARRWPEDAALDEVAGRIAQHGAEAAVERVATRLRLGPSDDYELLLAIAPERLPACVAAAAAAGTVLSVIGEFTSARGRLMLRDATSLDTPLEVRGYDHFA